MFFGSKNLQSSACSMFDRMFDQSPVLFSANHASKIWTKRREQGLDRLFDDVLWDPLNVENLKIFLKFCFFGSNYLLSPSFSQLNRKIKHEFDSDDRFSESWPWKDKFLKIQASEDYLNYVSCYDFWMMFNIWCLIYDHFMLVIYMFISSDNWTVLAVRSRFDHPLDLNRRHPFSPPPQISKSSSQNTWNEYLSISWAAEQAHHNNRRSRRQLL